MLGNCIHLGSFFFVFSFSTDFFSISATFFCVVFFIFRYHFVLPFSNGIFLVCPYVTQPAPPLSIPLLLFPSPCLALCVVCATMFKSFVGALPCNVIQLRPKMWQHFAARIVAFTTSVPYVCVCVSVCAGWWPGQCKQRKKSLHIVHFVRQSNKWMWLQWGPPAEHRPNQAPTAVLTTSTVPVCFSPLFTSLSLSVSFTRIVPLFGNYAARFNYDNSSERRSDNGKRQLQTKTSENATLRFLQLTWLQFAALLPAAVVSSV